METNKRRIPILKSKLNKCKDFHDEVLLNDGYYVPQENYPQLSKIEKQTTIVTKNHPILKCHKNDSRLVDHRTRLRQHSFVDDVFEKNNVTAFFFSGREQIIMTHNMLHRQSLNTSHLCSGTSVRHVSDFRISQLEVH